MAKFKRLVSIVLTIAMLCTTLLSTGMIAHASMLPLEEINACLVLNGIEEQELKSIPLSNVLNNLVNSNNEKITIPANATDVWMYVKDENNEDVLDSYNHYLISENPSLDLSTVAGITSYTLELIVGSGGQLNSNNVRYIIKVYLTNSISSKYTFELYKQSSNGDRFKVEPIEKTTAVGDLILTTMEATSFTLQEYDSTADYYLGMSETAEEHPNVKIKVYNGTAENLLYKMMFGWDSDVTDITSKVMHQDMTQSNAGYMGDFTDPNNYNGFLLVEYTILDWNTGLEQTQYALRGFGIDFSYSKSYLYSYEGGLKKDVACFSAREAIIENMVINPDATVSDVSGIHGMYFMLNEGYSVDEEYYVALELFADNYGADTVNHIEKAVSGSFNSLEEAINEEDIQQQLFAQGTNIGYKANFNYLNNGKFFTIFLDDGTVWKCNVRVMEYDSKYDVNYMRSFTDKPIIGEADPWLRVTGATGSDGTVYSTDNKNVYIVENGKSINMDTYYGYGYQTIFINKDKSKVDLSTLKPTIEYANDDRVYAVLPGASSPVDENHTRDFTNPNQQYTGIIDGNDRNYWVTFKALNNKGSELFVYGPSEREVILDEYFEFKHDILIANVGNAPLKDISVELLDAENVKLDPYWTVGGDGNDTLAAFTTTEKSTQYGELANIAKIRLLPDGDGEVKGTLIIRAEDQKPVMITLNGKAQNPKIVTERLDDAVKYVPYQHIVATDKIHDWIDTKFAIVEGTLPEGIELNKETGELYGVPLVPEDNVEEKIYTFTIEATYTYNDVNGKFDPAYASYNLFEPSRAELSITVKTNSDENVYNESDKNTESSDLNDGYTIKQHIGTQVNDYRFELDPSEEAVYISYGQYDEFKKLWLNGVLLEEDTDYTSEPGSTKITISSQTMENNTNPNGANTIAMEFRKDNDGDGKGDDGAEMNRTSQNYYVKQKTNAEKVIDKIALLPAASDINNNNLNSVKSDVQSARSAYDKLSSDEKNKVTNRQKLFDAEQKITDLNAANTVIAKINSIPANITTDAKDEIQAARNAYKALTEAQKDLVTNLDRLEKAEQALSKYETDIAAAQKVDDLIKNLPSPLKLEDEDKVNNARTAYSNLTADQKKYVTKEESLRAAENEIVRLKAEAQEHAKINAVITAIDAIPENLALSDKSTVEAARVAYNALTDSQKDKVINFNDLIKAEDAIKALEAQENANKADKAAAQEVIDLITNLPEEIALTDKTTVEEVRDAYEKLTDKQKELVTNYGDLTDAEAAIKALEDYEAANKKDQAAADEVINLINAIPSDITLDDKATVEAARSAYDALTDNQKKIVTNYNTLTDAEVKIAELENDNYEEVQSITLVGILVDKDGKALTDKVVEIHSVIQNGRTDENGSFQFNNVEFGKHTIFVKDENGNITAQREFNIVLGTPLALNGNEIIAENGSVFTIRMQLDGDELTFVNIEDGNKAPVVDTDKNDGVDIGEGDKTDIIPDTDVNTGNDQGNVSSPQTGDNSNLALWYTLLFASLGGLIVTTYSGMRKRKYVGKYQR